MEKAMISVIVPVYNVKEYLAKCVDSIIDQTYKNLEIILVDDGSTDGSSDICDEYLKKDARVVVIHQKNNGVSSARNAALDIAKGEYIAFADSDDYLQPDMYARLYKNIINYKCDVAVCGFMFCYPNGVEVKSYKGDDIVNVHNGIEGIKQILTGELYAGHLWNKLFKRELFSNIRLDKRVKVYEDALVLTRIFVNVKGIVFDSVPTYNYIIRTNSAYNSNYKYSQYTAHFALNKIRNICRTNNIDLIDYANANELSYSIYLLDKLFSSDIRNKNNHIKLLRRNIVNCTNRRSLSHVSTKITKLCAILCHINVYLINPVLKFNFLYKNARVLAGKIKRKFK